MQRQDAFFQYLPVDEECTSRGMYVTGAGRVVIGPGDEYPPSGHPMLYQFDWLRGRTIPDYQLLFVTQGAGEFESQATGPLDIEGPALIFLFPGVWHRYRPVPDIGWTERWFIFNGDLVHRLFDVGAFGPRLAVGRPQDPERLAADYDEVLDMIRRRSMQSPSVLAFRVLRMVSDAVASQLEDALNSGALLNRRSAATVEDPIVQKALEIIWSEGQHPISVGDIARQLPVTRRTLDRRFVEATGHSVLEEINACRLSRAKRLLAETDQPVKTVAHLAGFSSTERMRVLFVEREGKSPSEYRKAASQARHAQKLSLTARSDRQEPRAVVRENAFKNGSC